MFSCGMELSRAFCTASRSRRLESGLAPPSLAAMMISRASLVKTLPRSASTLPFFRRILCHFECPDISAALPYGSLVGSMGVWVYGCMGVETVSLHPYTHTPTLPYVAALPLPVV